MIHQEETCGISENFLSGIHPGFIFWNSSKNSSQDFANSSWGSLLLKLWELFQEFFHELLLVFLQDFITEINQEFFLEILQNFRPEFLQDFHQSLFLAIPPGLLQEFFLEFLLIILEIFQKIVLGFHMEILPEFI